MDYLDNIVQKVKEIDVEKKKVDQIQNEVSNLYDRANEIKQDDTLNSSVTGLTELKTLESCREPLETKLHEKKTEFQRIAKEKLNEVQLDKINYLKQQVEASKELSEKEADYKAALNNLIDTYQAYQTCFSSTVNEAYQEIKETGYQDYAVESGFADSYAFSNGFPTQGHRLDIIDVLKRTLDSFE